MSVEKALHLIKQHTKEGQFDQLTEMITSVNEGPLRNVTFLDELMQNLDLQEYSAGILCLLLNKIQLPGINFEQTFNQINEFIGECNEDQIRNCSNYFASLFHILTDLLVESKQYLKGVDLLCRAIVKVQQQPSQLTTIHSDLCKLCLLSKCMKPALAFLDANIIDINKENDTFDVKYYLLYFYYGGIIYCTLRNFGRAFSFFQSAISTPGSAVSEIMVEAYKKYILVSLLVYGKIQPVPRQNQTYLNRCIRPLVTAYYDLANAYTSDSMKSLEKVVNKHMELYTNDTNLGLVKQVVSSLIKVKIQKLTKTFMTLSLDDMTGKVNLENAQEAEKIILQMIEDEEVFASIDQRDGMVQFLDKPEKYNSPAMYRQIEQELNNCIKLNEKLKQLDQDIALSPKYQKIRSSME